MPLFFINRAHISGAHTAAKIKIGLTVLFNPSLLHRALKGAYGRPSADLVALL